MKALIMIDSFKGTITSKRLGEITQEEMSKKGIDSKYYPIADGGDGFLDAIEVFLKLKKVDIKCLDPLYREIDSYYLYDEDNKTAYIELAKTSGINLVKKEELNPYVATTFGLGQMIESAISNGSKKIVLGVGGSATNDGGLGMLEALGVKFFNKDNEEMSHLSNKDMRNIVRIDNSNFKKKIAKVKFLVLNDVTNPLLGENGATYVFSPQKGAKSEDLAVLESNMKYYSLVVSNLFGIDKSNYPGCGAVGGCGYALMTFCKAKFIPGIEYLLDLLEKNQDVDDYDMIITGEGKIDSQTLNGKVVSGISNRFKNKKIVLVCAINELENKNDFNGEIYSVVPSVATSEESMAHPEECYCRLIEGIDFYKE